MPRDAWEYRTVKLDVSSWLGPKVEPEKIDAELNAYGREGWELVSVVDVNKHQGTTSELVLVFKRQGR